MTANYVGDIRMGDQKAGQRGKFLSSNNNNDGKRVLVKGLDCFGPK